MGWFSDTIVNNNENTTEVRIIAGGFIVLVGIVIGYLCMRAHNKYTSAKIRQTAQSEVQLNNIRTQK